MPPRSRSRRARSWPRRRGGRPTRSRAASSKLFVPTCEQRLRTSTSSPACSCGAEIDLHAGEDERLEAAEDADARLLEIRRIDGVVHVPHRVAVAEADVLALDPGVRGHRARWYRGAMPGETTHGGLRAAGVAAGRPDRPAAARRGARRPHRLRHLVPRGADRRLRGAGARGGARPAERRHPGLRLARGRDGADDRGGARVPAATSGSSRATPSSPLAELADEVIVCTPEVERSWCHTASYTCAVAAIDALHGDDIAWLPARGRGRARSRCRAAAARSACSIAGAGRDWPTAQEAVLKLREGAWVAAERVRDRAAAARPSRRGRRPGTRAFVLEGEGRAAERAARARRARSRRSAVEMTLVPTRHPVVDIVRFHLLTLADRRGARHRPRSDPPRRPARRWAEAAGAAYPYA